ncbi:unnamed protein product [Phytophthora fragariaefolia]|uniref:Unnamed protein product n=1 Tax=Phytophthora fragariaefolia TaxID=1490495 RepID=A0A9W6Y4K0_9STRA|nr:unnamed protein product [Phytophthora fragariaefolia]
MDRKRERQRVVVEGQQETAVERGKAALEQVASKQQGQQALEWLALVDKMERRARGQEIGGDDQCFDARGEDGGVDDPERRAERAFARMLGLDEDSVELSAFSIETGDERSVGGTDHELSDDDKVTDAGMDHQVKLKVTKNRNAFDSPHRMGDKTLDDRRAQNIQASESAKLETSKRNNLVDESAVAVPGEADLHGSSLGSNKRHPPMNVDSVNPYREHMDHQARRT